MLCVIWSVATEISAAAALALSTDSITPWAAVSTLMALPVSDSAALLRR